MTANIELLLPFLMEGAKTLADAALKGEKLNDTGKKLVKTAYVESKIWGDELVASTETTLDDTALYTFQALMEDTADEAGIELPLRNDF